MTACAGVAHQPGDLFEWDTSVGQDRDERRVGFPAGPLVGLEVDAGHLRGPAKDLAELSPYVRRVQLRADRRSEDEPRFLPLITCRDALPALTLTLDLERVNGPTRQRERTAGLPRLGVAGAADRAPNGDVRRDLRSGGRISVEVDMIPAQRTHLLGAATGEERDHDVRVER